MRKAVRIYYHVGNKICTRESYNYWVGIPIAEGIAKHRDFKLLAIGTEEGAMCLHYRLS